MRLNPGDKFSERKDLFGVILSLCDLPGNFRLPVVKETPEFNDGAWLQIYGYGT